MRIGRSGPTGEYAGKVFEGYIRSQLTEERSRKASLEQRGTIIITTAGTLSTFLFGLAAFSRSPTTTFILSKIDEIALVSSLALLLAAAVCGLVTNRILSYHEPTVDYLASLTLDDSEHWRWTDVEGAARLIAEADVQQLRTARKLNDSKAVALQWALRTEILAILALALAVALTVFKI